MSQNIKVAGKSGKKSGGGLKMFWMPKKGHNNKHKHKKEKHHGRESEASISSQRGPAAAAAGSATMTQAMMSGDSPDTRSRTDPMLELKELPPLPVACSSNGAPGKVAAETVTASVLVEPQPRQPDPTGVTSPAGDDIASPIRPLSTSTDDDTIETAETPLANKKLDNGPFDNTDGDPTKLINNFHDIKIPEDEEEEGCGVKCLYYTLQCCECAIM